jgi:hypothetical protein
VTISHYHSTRTVLISLHRRHQMPRRHFFFLLTKKAPNQLQTKNFSWVFDVSWTNVVRHLLELLKCCPKCVKSDKGCWKCKIVLQPRASAQKLLRAIGKGLTVDREQKLNSLVSVVMSCIQYFLIRGLSFLGKKITDVQIPSRSRLRTTRENMVLDVVEYPK